MTRPELPPNVATFVLRRTWQDLVTENVYHVWQEGPHGAATLNALAEAFQSWWQGTWSGATIGPAQFDPFDEGTGRRVEMILIGHVKVLGLKLVSGWVSNQLAAGLDVPAPQAAAIVRWRTAYGGRGRTGRTYHGLLPSRMYEGAPAGRLDPSVRAGLELSYRTLTVVLTAATGVPGEFAPVLAHYRPMFPSDSSDGLWDFIVDGAIEDRRVRTQRRRVPRTRVP